MEDIRLFGNDGDYLILESLDGQKFRLMSDEALRSAIKQDVSSKLGSVSVTPREIQDHIRNGMSIEDIASESGAPLAFIEKFAAPVLDELAHMVDSAKSVRITTSHDRYSDSTHVEFGELVEARLGQSGASNFVWSAKRGDYNSWIVSVSFALAAEESFAAWSFDPRKLTLSPENESAVNLSTNDPLSSTPIPKLRPVLQAETEPSDALDIESSPFTAPLVALVAAEEDHKTTPKTPWVTQLASVIDPQPVENLPQESKQPESPLSATADLLQALRIKRGEREAAAESSLRNVDSSDNPASSQSSGDPAEQTGPVKEAQSETEAPVPAKKGRAAMPSWDQIVFGTKTED